MSPYSIACSTCGARLKVRDPKAIGELSLCPKCGSMVMITPPGPAGSDANIAPRGMSDSSQQIIVKRPAASLASDFEDAAALFADTVDDLVPRVAPAPKQNGDRATSAPPASPPTPVAKQAEHKPAAPATHHAEDQKKPAHGASGAAADSPAAKSAVRKVVVKKPASPPADVPKKPTPTDNGLDLSAYAAPAAVPPAPPPIVPPTESMSSIELDPLLSRGEIASPLAKSGAGLEQTFDLSPTPPIDNFAPLPPTPPVATPAGLADMPPPVVDDRPWASPTQQLLRRYALIGGAVAAAVVVVGVLLTIVFRHSTPPVTASVTDNNGQTNHNNSTPQTVDPAAPPAEETSTAVAPVPPVDPPPAETAADPPVDESSDDEPPMPPVEEPGIPPADDGDAPPLFTDDGDETPADAGSGDPPGEAVADSGLGDLAPLIDAFPIPATPERDPTDVKGPVAEPEAVAKRPRPEPLAVDVAARLADPIDGIDTGGAPLVKFLDLMSQLSTIPITLPPESLAQVQATANSPVSLVLRDANVEKVLQGGLAELGLKFEVRGEQLVIVPAPKRGAGPLTVGLAVEDLAPDAASLDALAEQIRRFVAPDAWTAAGGEAKIDTRKGKLDIFATQAVQFEVHVFCQKLRVARGLPPRSKLSPALFALATRSEQSAAKLSVPVRATFHAERPLTRILSHLEQAAGITLLVDWEALIAEGWPPHSTTAIVVVNQPLSTALDELLGPLDLAYRAIDENTIQITSRAALESRPELEFYPVAAQIDGGADPEKLVTGLKTKLGDELFAAADGTSEIEFDAASKCLIARVPQAFQRKLAAELSPAAE